MGKKRGERETERRRGREGGGERREGEKEGGGRHGVSVFDRVSILAIVTKTI